MEKMGCCNCGKVDQLMGKMANMERELQSLKHMILPIAESNLVLRNAVHAKLGLPEVAIADVDAVEVEVVEEAADDDDGFKPF